MLAQTHGAPVLPSCDYLYHYLNSAVNDCATTHSQVASA
jgi:hypothetical protein